MKHKWQERKTSSIYAYESQRQDPPLIVMWKKYPDQEELENSRTCLKCSHDTTSSSTPCCFSISAAFAPILCIYFSLCSDSPTSATTSSCPAPTSNSTQYEYTRMTTHMQYEGFTQYIVFLAKSWIYPYVGNINFIGLQQENCLNFLYWIKATISQLVFVLCLSICLLLWHTDTERFKNLIIGKILL